MHYEFPFITNISDVLPHIEGRDEFVVTDKGSYTVINYNVMFDDTFPSFSPIIDNGYVDPGITEALNYSAAIRRECRGIIFDGATGTILRRPFHKFFNIGERPETHQSNINLNDRHVILEKLDGSMIAPFYAAGVLVFGTKAGATTVSEPVEHFVNENPRYIEFAAMIIELGYTPIFEWCSRKQRIVLDYPEDYLCLTAIRHMADGDYMSYDNMDSYAYQFDIPVVGTFDSTVDLAAFVDYVHDLEDEEGYVIRFDSGMMLKQKSKWYVQIHKAKEAILQDRNIVQLILEEKLDDIKSHLLDSDYNRLTHFENDFNYAINEVVNNIQWEIQDLVRMEIDRKTFALEYAPYTDQYTKQIIFSLWDDFATITRNDIVNKVHNTIMNNLTKTVKYEAIRDAWFPGLFYNT